jgi:hypothetical protein
MYEEFVLWAIALKAMPRQLINIQEAAQGLCKLSINLKNLKNYADRYNKPKDTTTLQLARDIINLKILLLYS